MKINSESRRVILSRRDFLYKLGLGTSIAVTGYIIADSFSNSMEETSGNSTDKPSLNKDVVTYYKEDELFLEYRNSKFCVNNIGAEIVHFLDGEHTVSDISSRISGRLNIDHTDMLEASIAKFICQLAGTGFLSLPFYVTLYENYD